MGEGVARSLGIIVTEFSRTLLTCTFSNSLLRRRLVWNGLSISWNDIQWYRRKAYPKERLINAFGCAVMAA